MSDQTLRQAVVARFIGETSPDAKLDNAAVTAFLDDKETAKVDAWIDVTVRLKGLIDGADADKDVFIIGVWQKMLTAYGDRVDKMMKSPVRR